MPKIRKKDPETGRFYWVEQFPQAVGDSISYDTFLTSGEGLTVEDIGYAMHNLKKNDLYKAYDDENNTLWGRKLPKPAVDRRKYNTPEKVHLIDFILATVFLSAFLVYGLPEVENAIFWFYRSISKLL